MSAGRASGTGETPGHDSAIEVSAKVALDVGWDGIVQMPLSVVLQPTLEVVLHHVRRAPCARGGGADTRRSSGRSHSLLSWLATSVSAPKRLAITACGLVTHISRAAVGSMGAQRSAHVNTVAPQRAILDHAPRSWPTQVLPAA